MAVVAACAMTAALGWAIGYMATVLLMIAIVALALRQGWAVILCLMGILVVSRDGSQLSTEYRELVAVTLSLVMLATFAAIQVQLRQWRKVKS